MEKIKLFLVKNRKIKRALIVILATMIYLIFSSKDFSLGVYLAFIILYNKSIYN